jgi:hypothetical protein
MDRYEKQCWECKKILNADVDGDPYWNVDYMQSSRRFGCAPLGCDNRTYCEQCFSFPNQPERLSEKTREGSDSLNNFERS